MLTVSLCCRDVTEVKMDNPNKKCKSGEDKPPCSMSIIRIDFFIQVLIS